MPPSEEARGPQRTWFWSSQLGSQVDSLFSLGHMYWLAACARTHAHALLSNLVPVWPKPVRTSERLVVPSSNGTSTVVRRFSRDCAGIWRWMAQAHWSARDPSSSCWPNTAGAMDVSESGERRVLGGRGCPRNLSPEGPSCHSHNGTLAGGSGSGSGSSLAPSLQVLTGYRTGRHPASINASIPPHWPFVPSQPFMSLAWTPSSLLLSRMY